MIEGRAVLYGVKSAFPLKGLAVQEMILPGAFTESVARGRTLRGKRIYCDLNHDRSVVLARIGRGLELEDRPEGVFFRLAIPLLPGIRGMSFTFNRAKWTRQGSLYIVQSADLKSISVLTRMEPAYPTLATIRGVNNGSIETPS
jgi:HK97 family phage prohead protease